MISQWFFFTHVYLCFLCTRSHRHAYHQEDLLLLLANLPVESRNSNGRNNDSQKHNTEDYCNLNRVAWGSKEDPSFLWLNHNWHGLKEATQLQHTEPSTGYSSSPVGACAERGACDAPTGTSDTPVCDDVFVAMKKKEKLLPSGRGPGGWIKPWLGPLYEPSTGKEKNAEVGEEKDEEEEASRHRTRAFEGTPPLVERCCAQFLVSRELVRRRPREFYQAALDEVCDFFTHSALPRFSFGSCIQIVWYRRLDRHLLESSVE